MTNYISLISGIKVDQFENAVATAIPVKNLSGGLIGKLVPVGNWILDDLEKIEAIRTWRSKARRMFFTQLDSTYEQTRTYLKATAIDQPNRLLFLLFDHEDKFIGHLGICNVSASSCELDNLMRGNSGGSPRLVYFAEVALLDWCFKMIGVVWCDVNVLTYNFMVIDLHAEVGFFEVERKSLKKIMVNGNITHQVVDPSESNVSYGCIEMRLLKDFFLKKWQETNVHSINLQPLSQVRH